jgi:acetylornithine deacetylase/succinyl-diaminopimelate desuccinylase-like protein
MLRGMAPFQESPLDVVFADPQKLVDDDAFMLSLQQGNPGTHALLRNTCSITRLEGSAKINVVPSEAWAELDCRLLPDQDPEAFLADLRALIGDETWASIAFWILRPPSRAPITNSSPPLRPPAKNIFREPG